jgi:hypothetical protein
MRARNLRKAGLLAVSVGIGAMALVSAASVSGAVATTGTAPAGYSIVTSAPVTAVNGRQTHAPVACPATTKPISGGAHVDSSSTLVNLNSSYPVGRRSWSVRVNNLSGADVTFEVYAVCVSRPALDFTVSTRTVGNHPHQVQSARVGCAKGVMVGGGVKSNSVKPEVSIHYMGPDGAPAFPTAWVVLMDNPTASPEGFTVYSVCRKHAPDAAHVVVGSETPNPAGTQTAAIAQCEDGNVAVAGGGFSSSTAQTISMSSSFPQGQGWSSAENNTGTRGETAGAAVICSGPYPPG